MVVSQCVHQLSIPVTTAPQKASLDQERLLGAHGCRGSAHGRPPPLLWACDLVDRPGGRAGVVEDSSSAPGSQEAEGERSQAQTLVHGHSPGGLRPLATAHLPPVAPSLPIQINNPPNGLIHGCPQPPPSNHCRAAPPLGLAYWGPCFQNTRFSRDIQGPTHNSQDPGFISLTCLSPAHYPVPGPQPGRQPLRGLPWGREGSTHHLTASAADCPAGAAPVQPEGGGTGAGRQGADQTWPRDLCLLRRVVTQMKVEGRRDPRLPPLPCGRACQRPQGTGGFLARKSTKGPRNQKGPCRRPGAPHAELMRSPWSPGPRSPPGRPERGSAVAALLAGLRPSPFPAPPTTLENKSPFSPPRGGLGLW